MSLVPVAHLSGTLVPLEAAPMPPAATVPGNVLGPRMMVAERAGRGPVAGWERVT